MTRVICRRGSTRGPLGAILFCLAAHPLFQRALDGLALEATAYIDDFNAVSNNGTRQAQQDIFRCLQRLVRHGPDYGLHVNARKTEVCWPHSDEPPPEEIVGRARRRGVEFTRGTMETLGAFVGDDEGHVRERVAEKVNGLERFFNLLRHPALPKQQAFLLLSYCAQTRANFLARVVKPHLAQEALGRFDTFIEEVVQHLLTDGAHLNIWDLGPLRPQIQLPIRCGGLGLPPRTDVSFVAFWAAAVAAIEHIPEERWEHLPDTPGSYKHTLRFCDAHLTRLGVPGDMRLEFERFRETTKTRRMQREFWATVAATRHEDYLESLQDDTVALARVHGVSGTHASAWMKAIPNRSALIIPDAAFTHALRLRLGVPPARVRVGATCRLCKRQVADPAHFLACDVPRRGWAIHRHDSIKVLLATLARRADQVVVVEPFRHEESRFDLLITGVTGRFAVDVAVIHPTCRKHRTAAARGVGEATAEKERQKLGLQGHARLAELERASLVPFVVETYGHLGAGAIEILTHIATVGEHLEYGFYELVAMVSVAIQLGNARLHQCGGIEADRVERGRGRRPA